MSDQADFLARARAAGMSTADAMLFRDLTRHAARQAWETIERIADNAPGFGLRLSIKLNACNALYLTMADSVRQSGPFGHHLLAQFEAFNASQQSPGPAAADPETPGPAPLPEGVGPPDIDQADTGGSS